MNGKENKISDTQVNAKDGSNNVVIESEEIVNETQKLNNDIKDGKYGQPTTELGRILRKL